jgi:hypothetical protein
MLEENWLPVVGYEGHYEVSDQGRVRSLDRRLSNVKGTPFMRGRILKPNTTRHRYPSVVLCALGVRTHKRIHRLVISAFVGPPPPGMECCHNDGDPSNNTLGNLRWGTHSDNMRDACAHGTFVNNSAKLRDADVLRIRSCYVRSSYNVSNTRELAKEFGVSLGTIRGVISKSCWAHI